MSNGRECHTAFSPHARRDTYTLAENLQRVRENGPGTKRSLAMREFVLPLE